MTNHEAAIAVIETFIEAWRQDRITALRAGNADLAHDCQMKIDGLVGVLQSLAATVAA
jgi:hypothetical protein